MKKNQIRVSVNQLIWIAFLISVFWLIYIYLLSYCFYIQSATVCFTSQSLNRFLSLLNDADGKGPITDAITQQVTCSAKMGSNCQLSEQINEGVWCAILVSSTISHWGQHFSCCGRIIESFVISGQGIVVFCLVGLSKESLATCSLEACSLFLFFFHTTPSRKLCSSGIKCLRAGKIQFHSFLVLQMWLKTLSLIHLLH